MPPVEGSIRIRGRAIDSPGPDRMMVFQEFEQLMPWKTVYQNVLFPMKVTKKFAAAEAVRRTDAVIEKVGLAKFRDVYPHMLSGGMKMRVSIARAMAAEPDILLMDEPFAALDALTRRTMQRELLALWEQLRFTVLFVTHSIEEATSWVASRVPRHPPRPREPNADGLITTASARPSPARCRSGSTIFCSATAESAHVRGRDGVTESSRQNLIRAEREVDPSILASSATWSVPHRRRALSTMRPCSV